ncbi:MAG: 1,4-dihydroxy-2-naphthoate polyprenyltransferase [Bdellovibrionales bacterium CG12_big_fil_rev_8_21_14_0_65_38_15]|nr:MAG: 1,4-dihydroxy-2-naphthoate polyprenyltransferase [Bdellovibrionales bacterium CG22_combo_CG10-13_8_21_14_all_38_13]PIQ56377.1 MAG: 1,4-dihydroxy-2-naphthoate polyprenyltransferase [Bdellovibrionales bacterium CG12_big_fil_rev_8_21_14_0_65_38_15]PIR29408.1 MAG: 1,4-dihydroxy-2-naphthoate polyprenyltransferase [Bdellovibrionales bacterium CG11_big_fil_rev_8_21_14_0_20_38_13]
MTQTNPWILAARPKTLPAALSPIILGLGYCLHIGLKINIETAGITLFCTVLLQISSNLINDYYDGVNGVDTEDRLGPTRVTSSGLLTPSAVKTGFMATLGLAFLLGLHLMSVGGLPIVIIGFSSIFFAWAYTGGPYPLSQKGLGEIAALIFFGPVAVWGTVWIQSPTSFDSMPIFLGIGPGLISAGILAINNLRDIVSDSKVNKITLAVKLGESKARKMTFVLIASSLFVPIYLGIIHQRVQFILPVIVYFIFFKNWQRILFEPIDKKLNDTLANTGKYLLLYCITLSIALVWN